MTLTTGLRTGAAHMARWLNLMCPLPRMAGYKAKSTLVGATAVGSLQCTASTTTTCVGAYEIEACGKGTVSSWDLGFTTRTPAEPLKCQACTLNLHAPRSGKLECAEETWLSSMLA